MSEKKVVTGMRHAKQQIVLLLERAMSQEKMTHSELAKRMRTSRAVVYRLLNKTDLSLTMGTLCKALVALNRNVRLSLSEPPAA